MSPDALADALTREDHRQGRPFGESGHCEACDEIASRALRQQLIDECTHSVWIDVTPLGELPGSRRICAGCGRREAP